MLDDINPALTNPATVAIGPAAVNETYNNTLSPAATGIASAIIPDAVYQSLLQAKCWC